MGTIKKMARAFVPRRVRNWLRSPIDSLSWSWAQAKYHAGARLTLEIRPGWRLVCHPAARRFAYAAQENDPEQVAEFDSFIESLTPGAVLFDIGAHFGLFSLAALHYGGVMSRAIAVDPSPMAVGFMKKQAKINRVVDRMSILQAAVSDRVGRQSMVSVGVLASGYYMSPSTDHTPSETTSTPTTTLDQLAQEFGLSPTHIKIDVEGYELAVISGGRKLLSQHKPPLLFVELHNDMVRQGGGDPQETLSLLRDLGYDTIGTDGTVLDDRAILDKGLIRIVARKTNSEAAVGGSRDCVDHTVLSSSIGTV